MGPVISPHSSNLEGLNKKIHKKSLAQVFSLAPEVSGLLASIVAVTGQRAYPLHWSCAKKGGWVPFISVSLLLSPVPGPKKTQ